MDPLLEEFANERLDKAKALQTHLEIAVRPLVEFAEDEDVGELLMVDGKETATDQMTKGLPQKLLRQARLFLYFVFTSF